MLFITNRVLRAGESGLDVFGKEPNPSGPNEIRLVEVNEDGSEVRPLEERLGNDQLSELEDKHGFTVDRGKEWYVSLRVACDLFAQARGERKQLLFFVHGYNNDMGDVLRSAYELQELYDVIVIPFSWPANGGGKISGSAAYLSDKDDARASATALHRAVEKVRSYHQLLTEGTRRRLTIDAERKYPDDRERAHEMYARCMRQECKISINLLCHSMGNYVLKHAALFSNSSLRHLTFDNVLLVAADVNNPGHAGWVDNIPVRNRMYVVINEEDYALRWSRMKPGSEQLSRLGHHLRNLVSRNVHYIDVTNADGVDDGHSYFKGQAVSENGQLKTMFQRMFEGGIAESTMSYHPDVNAYRLS